MKKIAFYGVTLIILLIAQTALLSRLRVGYAAPDIILVCVVTIGMLRGLRTAIHTGFIMGLAQDVMLAGPVGINALTKVWAGALCGALYNKIDEDNYFNQCLVILVMTLFQQAAYHFFGMIFTPSWAWTSLSSVAGGSALNCAAVILFFPLYRRWEQWWNPAPHS